ncbi:pituitary tumor-transforming gene 1 protein-interacting protein-like [Actinia tenebrosa]|uniref:Pituitary tumor-transforming gene 1 protein-interacting protein-like n=1 Tax=Actinia tenebrosa TaxID=6105 RepID=A0A6P8ID66_ACTTE|nr:pituitary tumor-transforming gene 1 protein-interacting protein-like [Actinia tenebrosa]
MGLEVKILVALFVFTFTLLQFTSPVSAEFDCSKYTNTSCSSCTENSACYWCKSSTKCIHYPGWTKVVPHDCPHKDWYYGQCRISGFVLIILVPSLAAFALIFLCCCVYCCCCRRCKKWKQKRHDKEDIKLKRKRDEMQLLHSQRRNERQAKADNIRKKYGLLPSGGYERLGDE